jgi:hypothetical protein
VDYSQPGGGCIALWAMGLTWPCMADVMCTKLILHVVRMRRGSYSEGPGRGGGGCCMVGLMPGVVGHGPGLGIQGVQHTDKADLTCFGW